MSGRGGRGGRGMTKEEYAEYLLSAHWLDLRARKLSANNFPLDRVMCRDGRVRV